MQLLDVYNDTIRDCTKATTLVNSTNEFYNNSVASNGTVYSTDIHSCVIDGAFLTLFMAFERFLELSFLCYMMGQPGLNGNTFTRYVSPVSEENAFNMIKGNNRFADFTNRDIIVRLANNFFDAGGTYTYLNSISGDFEEMKKIRNAISHVSVESEKSFQGLVRTKIGSLPPNMNTSTFLNTIVPGTSTTFFIHYKDIVVSTIDNSKGRFLHYGAWLGTERQPSYKERLRAAICDALAKGPDSFDAFLRLMEESGYAVKRGRGGAISFLVPGQQRATRLRSSTLGEGFDPGDIRDVIAGKRPMPKLDAPAPAAPRRVDLIVDIQERLRSGKGPAYERWVKVYNLKQMAAALQFMREHQISEYDQLTTEAEAASTRFHALTEQLRQTEADLAYTSELMGAVVQYAKTRPVFDEYKAVKYSKRFLTQHEAELADYRAAKATLNDLLDGAKLPKMAQLKEKRRKLAAEKKALYAKYRAAQQEMRQAVAVKTNIDYLLGVTDGCKNKEQER